MKDIQVSDKVKEQIKKVAQEAFKKAGIVSREAAFDNKKFDRAIGIVYKLLPIPVRLIVRKNRIKDIMVNIRELLFKPNKSNEEGLKSNQLEYDKIKQLIGEHYNKGIEAANKGLYSEDIEEFEKALEYNPPPEVKILLYHDYASMIWLKNNFQDRDGASISHEEYEEVKKVHQLYKQVIDIYEKLDKDIMIETEIPIKELYNKSKSNLSAFSLYGHIWRDAHGNPHRRD